MSEMKSFTDIKQFRDTIKSVRHEHDYKGKNENGEAIYRHDSPYPVLKFRGTPKIHGTNAGIVMYKDGTINFQSRERVLSLTADNASFMLSMKSKQVEKLFEGIEFNEYCGIYGEWCGQGIQKGIAISSLPKMFVIFAVRIDGIYQDMEKFKHLKNEEERIFNILQFPSYTINIDFEKPEMIQNTLCDLTIAVETECPVGKYFGVEKMNSKSLTFTIENNEIKCKEPLPKFLLEDIMKSFEIEVFEENVQYTIFEE